MLHYVKHTIYLGKSLSQQHFYLSQKNLLDFFPCVPEKFKFCHWKMCKKSRAFPILPAPSYFSVCKCRVVEPRLLLETTQCCAWLFFFFKLLPSSSPTLAKPATSHTHSTEPTTCWPTTIANYGAANSLILDRRTASCLNSYLTSTILTQGYWVTETVLPAVLQFFNTASKGTGAFPD